MAKVVHLASWVRDIFCKSEAHTAAEHRDFRGVPFAQRVQARAILQDLPGVDVWTNAERPVDVYLDDPISREPHRIP